MTYVLAVVCLGSACDPTGAGAGYEPPPTVRADATWRAGPPPADRFALDPNSDEFIEATEGDAIEPDRYALTTKRSTRRSPMVTAKSPGWRG